MSNGLPIMANNSGLIDILRELFTPLIDFFNRFGEIGLFIYSIIETITPIAGVEFILIPLILSPNASPWWVLTLNLVTANTIGAVIVYLFMAKEDNKIYNKLVTKNYRERAKKLFDRYGFWAIFIFAMTPLPFFVIIFTAAIAKMKFKPYVFAVFFSRGVRFSITSYFVHRAGSSVSTGAIVFWIALVGVGFAGIMMFLQRKMLAYFEKKANES